MFPTQPHTRQPRGKPAGQALQWLARLMTARVKIASTFEISAPYFDRLLRFGNEHVEHRLQSC